MFILRYLKKTGEPSHPLLPKPWSRAKESANITVVASMEAARQRKQKNMYNYYDPDLSAKIGHYTAENDNKTAVSCLIRDFECCTYKGSFKRHL